jgi:hypothetical protein
MAGQFLSFSRAPTIVLDFQDVGTSPPSDCLIIFLNSIQIQHDYLHHLLLFEHFSIWLTPHSFAG